ncbi:hypothetical protein COHA_008190 [Chlorella ohadii]|uniref:Uncharacterized protein n=1 Tax=Chlorella ohadii TaxID=2649997 RepID=A0AAD5H1U6_9CHLO|nr:hypothetical protein COHA_008190 [Chlorella ohadii]
MGDVSGGFGGVGGSGASGCGGVGAARSNGFGADMELDMGSGSRGGSGSGGVGGSGGGGGGDHGGSEDEPDFRAAGKALWALLCAYAALKWQPPGMAMDWHMVWMWRIWCFQLALAPYVNFSTTSRLMAWGAVVSYLSSGLGVLQLWVLTRPTQHAPQLQQAAELCAANRTDPSTVHQPYSVLPASPQQLAGWEQVPLTGRRRPALPPAADEGQQSWLRRLTHGLADLAWAGLAVVSPKAEQAVLQWKTWGRMLPEGTFWVLCAALYPEDHPTTRTAQQLLQQALAAAKAEAKQQPDTASAMLLSASPPEIRVYSHPVGCTVAGRTDGQRIVLWDRFNDAHTVAHELAHCLLRHCDESAQLMRSPERWSHYGVLRCQQELEAEQCALLWAARMGAAPKQYVRRQISGSPWWHPLLPSGIGTHALQGWLHRHAAADPTALTSVDSRDRGGTGVWPSEAKQAHFYALVLPRAAQLYASSAAVTRSRLIGAAVVAALSFQGERMQNSLAWLFVSLLL